LAISEHWPIDRIRQVQLTKLRRLIDRAARYSPFYRREGLPRSDAVRCLEGLQSLPLLTRDDIRHYGRDLCCLDAGGDRLKGHTHGTTDDQLVFFWDRTRQAWDKANRLRAHRWHRLVPGDRELHVWPLDPPLSVSGMLKQWLRDRRDDLFGDMQVDSLRAFGERLPLTWAAWRRFDPHRVTAYPSLLAQLIQDGRQVGCTLGNRSLQRIFLTGEVTFDWQRRLIERELGVPTVQDYGVQEVGALAYACPEGYWHVSAESALIEIIRHGRPARPGEYGEIVVTGLESRVMPVIRYCTGDIVKMPEREADAPRACSCGLTLPVLPPVRGRAADFLETVSGEWIEPALVVRTLGEVLNEGSFQVLQRKSGEVEVFVAGPSVSARAALGSSLVSTDCESAIRDRVARLLGRGTRCLIRRVPSLHRSLFGKCRYVSSERTIGGLAAANHD
jgi:phenylacetate-CoA ligase